MKNIVKRIYLSGAISEDPDYERKFKCAADQLRAKGFIVINPVEYGHKDLAEVDIKDSWEWHLMKDLSVMLGCGKINDACQGLAVIPYGKSVGADLERTVAEALDFYIMEVDEWLTWTGDKYSIPLWMAAE
jgi:hypothetical protein